MLFKEEAAVNDCVTQIYFQFYGFLPLMMAQNFVMPPLLLLNFARFHQLIAIHPDLCNNQVVKNSQVERQLVDETAAKPINLGLLEFAMSMKQKSN